MEISKILVVCVLFLSFENAFCIQTYYMSTRCGDTLSIIGKERARIKLTALSKYASNIKDCRLIVSASPSDQIRFSFEDMDIENSTNCNNDRLTIYDGDYFTYSSSKPPRIGPRFCGRSTPSTSYESTEDYITLQFYSDSSVEYRGFDIIVTQFHTGSCYSWETKCDNGNCIDDSIACAGYNPCGDGSDCNARTIAIIIGCSVGGVALVGIGIAVGVCVYCSRRRSPGRAGYMANGAPVATTMPSTSFGGQYNPPPGYNPNVYGVSTVGQTQYSTPITTNLQYSQPMAP